MADVLNYPGLGANGGVPGPYLQNAIYAANEGLSGKIALGMGRMARRFTDIVSAEQGGLTEAQLTALIVASAQAGGAAAQSINFNYQGMQGPPGPPGVVTTRYVALTGSMGQSGPTGATGADAFDDIDIPIPYDGWEGGFTDNSPGAGSVAWTSFKIKYKGTEYTITAANTANEYLYWDVGTPTALSSTATRTNAVGIGKFFVGRNNAGAFEQSQFLKLITAGFISVNSLSALAADLGTITSGTITMNLGTTYRLQISPSGIRGSADSGSNWANIITLDGTDVLIQGTKIKAGTIETTQLGANAVSAYDMQQDASGSWVQTGTNIVTATAFAVPSGFVRIGCEVELQSAVGTALQNATITLRRGTDVVKSWVRSITNGGYSTFSFSFIDAPAAATYDYHLRISGSADAGDFQNAVLTVEGLKK